MAPERGESHGEESLEAQLESLLDSFVQRFREGEQPSITEYTEKYPHLSKKIVELFPASTLLGDLQGDGSGKEQPPMRRLETLPVGEAARRLGEYRLLREVGRGGMGVVYEAEQESLKRHVALKVLPFHSLMDSRYLERFRREAQAAAKLQHPNIVPVYGLGKEHGIHFYAMQFVQGAGLDQVLRDVKRLSSAGGNGGQPESSDLSTTLALGLLSGPVDSGGETAGQDPSAPTPAPGSGRKSRERLPREYFVTIARIGQKVAEALAYAHENGIYHRDIKPSNLLLDASASVWVTDFGLAKAEESDDLTRSGELVGTLRYMAPESLHGIWDARSDVYGLGITLHELLTLEPAFQADSKAGLVKKVSEEIPLAPRKVRPRIPRALETVVLKATCKEPARRYQSSTELAEDLGRFIEGRAVTARLPGVGYRLSRIVRRQKLVLALICLVLVLGMCFGFALIPRKPLVPQGLVVEDLDGDGDIDLAVANMGHFTDVGPDSFSIILNRGGGTFRRPRRVQVGDFPTSPGSVDFDGDGDPDLVFANGKSKDISLLRNEGGGRFRNERLLELENHPTFIAAEDFDNDGDVDIACVFYQENGIKLFLNDEGVFSEGGTVEDIPRPWFVKTADLNNDGRFDLVTSNRPSQNVSVVLNGRGGKFAPAEHYDVGDSPQLFTTADLNGDGFLDIAVAHDATPGVAVFINSGEGRFPQKAASYPLDSLIAGVGSGDFNGDGYVDLVGAGGAADFSYACLMLNNRDRPFGEPVELTTGQRPRSIKGGDLDGDGDLDIVISNLDSDSLTLLFNDGSGNFDRVETLALGSWFFW